ncbi:hypothetical protein A2276_02720 [candidate division WOR-1 bacterium RIFOXYA12_FULL_43_27]|uniref:dTTP/UTP pyrophosphatase n=1 Tax=candidate division WOR-1 bacterium RIFOXYC2_FULL_46_14 TaxID=1802587 RepID=A0A1F4U7N4_UNCSA|nr:MAG: hypothetical protein A2276_02720 [candidate division WOR-1 bacterium RIFOXYA12_FULL_43_27]OGC19377.1 MAG: hypothetical protein A2292_01610 [candidate division WOR-1 bacterium RIFOXYB2_FULL_46_45]OGC30366.1 MAG: hypothetical protein A2232_01610 [candidate division WOR-1 bacterium RIFOXYA2_FULL_46_56]OGC40966.1 MAG: hypothetical protein A2438_01610 [candidate division WOR-1 bacterium RIFOXYC2_FULL_46_14]
MRFVLASQSPRRKELLKKAVPEFTVLESGVDEAAITKRDPVEFAVEAAILKAKAIGDKDPEATVLGADTVVAIDRKILGKPKDEADARKTLALLSGTKHKVITGIALYKKDEDKLLTDYELTYVKFKKLSEKDIDEYLATGGHADKAGSYAIQETGDKFVEKIDGDYDNVVGLPVARLKKLLKRFNAEEIAVEIQDIALPDNLGVAKYEGETLFIPNAVWGDKVSVRLGQKHRGVQYAEITKITEESSFRDTPPCPHFGICGGCVFQNLKYEKQLELKKKNLDHNLRTIGKTTLSFDLMVYGSPSKYHYRNKMEFAFGEEEGKIILGLRKRGTHQTAAIGQCEIFSPLVSKIFPIILDFVARHHLDMRFLRHLVVREGKRTGELMLILVTRNGKLPDPGHLIATLVDQIPQLKSFYWVKNDQLADVVAYEEVKHLYGEKFITDLIGPKRYYIYPQTFFQPNTLGAEILYGKVAEFAELTGKQRILGLYCGAGSIEVFLADHSKRAIGIDLSEFNIETAKENAKLNNLDNCIFHAGEVEKLLRDGKFDADVVVVDPPRSGLSGKAIKLILGLNVPKLIYVSCNPATFARDLAVLQEGKYSIKDLAAIDMFPQTTHLESIALLTLPQY